LKLLVVVTPQDFHGAWVRVTLLRLFALFEAVKVGPPLAAERLRLTESVLASKSKSIHLRPDRATVKRYQRNFCKQLDERGTLEPRKDPGSEPRSWTRRPPSSS
jgi:hypothetical protein